MWVSNTRLFVYIQTCFFLIKKHMWYDMAGVDDTVSFTTILLGPWFLGLCSKVNSKSIDYLEIVDFDSMPLIWLYWSFYKLTINFYLTFHNALFLNFTFYYFLKFQRCALIEQKTALFLASVFTLPLLKKVWNALLWDAPHHKCVVWVGTGDKRPAVFHLGIANIKIHLRV